MTYAHWYLQLGNQSEHLEELSGDDGEYESKIEAVGSFIGVYKDHRKQIEELEQTIERLQNEKHLLTHHLRLISRKSP